MVGCHKKDDSMHFLIEQVLLLVILASLMLCNCYLGFLAHVIGEYRIKKKQKRPTSLLQLYREKEMEAWQTYASGDVSVLVAVLILSTLGLPFLILVQFGPVGKDTHIESKVKPK
jgi:hypothetical protein